MPRLAPSVARRSRRNFFKTILGVGVGLQLPTSARAAAPPEAGTAFSQLFDFSHQAPLNAANLCPALRSVLAAQQTFTQGLSADVSFINRRNFVQGEIATAREACARMLNLKTSDDLAFVRNTSEANAVIVNGLDLAPDDEVLLWDQNHATNYRSWHYRHQQTPFKVRSFSLPENPESAAQIIAPILAGLSPRTRVLSFSHLSNISGMRLPAEAICRAVRRQNPDIFIHIDGAQSWGSMAVDLQAIDCDSYASSGHKWLCGPRGTGILMVKKSRVSELRPLILGYDFNFDYPQDAWQDDARRFENLGQRDTAAIGTLAHAVAAHRRMGIAQIESRISELTRHAQDGFAQAGIKTITPQNPAFGHGVVVGRLSSNLKAYGAFLALHNAGYAAAFVHRNTVHCSPKGIPQEDDSPVYLRICPHAYNNEADIDAAVAIAKRIDNSAFEIIREAIRFL